MAVQTLYKDSEFAAHTGGPYDLLWTISLTGMQHSDLFIRTELSCSGSS